MKGTSEAFVLEIFHIVSIEEEMGGDSFLCFTVDLKSCWSGIEEMWGRGEQYKSNCRIERRDGEVCLTVRLGQAERGSEEKTRAAWGTTKRIGGPLIGPQTNPEQSNQFIINSF